EARSDACASRPVRAPSPRRFAAEVTKKTPARKAVASRRAMDSFFCVPVLIAVGWWFLQGRRVRWHAGGRLWLQYRPNEEGGALRAVAAAKKACRASRGGPARPATTSTGFLPGD